MPATTDPLRDLIASTLAFYARFEYQPTVPDAVGVFREEVAELIEAAELGTDIDHIAEEAIDVLVTVVGVCAASGVDAERLVRQLYAVINKNDAKTHSTHIKQNGKIRRRPPAD